MDVRDLDLNLLVAFDALMQEASVTLAARRLGLSQPAMSYALSRLRIVFGDPLFVRIGNRMSPTPQGAAIGEAVKRVIRMVQEDVLQRARFDPASTHRAFQLCMTAVSEFTFVARIVQRLAERAPNVSLQMQGLSNSDLQNAMGSGNVDLAVGYFPELQETVFQQKLFESGFACIARKGNPYLEGGLTLENFCAASHVAMKVRTHHSVIERDLRAVGIERRVKVTVQHFQSLSTILATSDMLAVVPVEVTPHLARVFEAQVCELPYPSSRFEVRQYWHERYHKDPANQWIRTQVRDLLQSN
jgi:DNA-binding transcriptional LysR family regulator